MGVRGGLHFLSDPALGFILIVRDCIVSYNLNTSAIPALLREPGIHVRMQYIAAKPGSYRDEVLTIKYCRAKNFGTAGN